MTEAMDQGNPSITQFPRIPEISVTHISPPSKSSSPSSLFSASSALQSNSTTPSATPDPALGASDATSKLAQHSLVGHQGSVNRPPVSQRQPQTAQVASLQQAAPVAQHYPRPQVQPSRHRPYPEEIYAQAYISPSAHHAAYPMPSNSFPAGMHPPGMMHPGMAMGMGTGMAPAGFIPQPPQPGGYIPQPMGPYSPYQYGYHPQPQYYVPDPQTMNATTSYPMHSGQVAPPPPSFLIHPPVAPRAGHVQAAPPPAPAFQMLVHQGPLAEGPSSQVEGIINGLQPNFVPYYNPGESHAWSGDVPRAENVQEPGAQPQFPPQMQGGMTLEHNAAMMGQEMGYPNAGVMQLPASTGCSSLPPSSGNGKGKGKRGASDNDDAQPKLKRKKHPRLRPSEDPNFKYDSTNDKGHALYKCLLPQCALTKPMQEGSVDAHRKSDRHSQKSGKYPCEYCGKGLSRGDARLRHETGNKECRDLRAKMMGPTAAVADEPGPSAASGSAAVAATLVAAPSGSFTIEVPMAGPGPMHMQAQPPSVPAVSYALTAQPTTWRRAPPRPVQQQASQVPVQPTAQAQIVQPRAVLQATSGVPPLPVFAQATSILQIQPSTQVSKAEPCAVPQSASGGPPLPVIAQDFFTMGPTRQPQQPSGVPPPVVAGDIDVLPDVTGDDEIDDLFESAEMSSPGISTSLALPPVPAAEEATPDAPAAQTTPADAPAPFSFDLAALDLPFDDWTGNGEQSLDDALAEAFAEVFADTDSWMG